MDISRFYERKADLIKAVTRLNEACEQPASSFIRDAVIQRFEFCWELTWKVLRMRLQQLGDSWSQLQKMRNLTSHTYDEKLADEVYAYVTQAGRTAFTKLVSDMATWRIDESGA